MPTEARGDISALLERVRTGDAEARERLAELTYGSMRQIALALMRGERPDHTLQPTALLNEAMVRLLKGDVLLAAPNRAYLFGAAATAMRRILIEHERQRRAEKRGGDLLKRPIEAAAGVEDAHPSFGHTELLDAIDQLAKVHERASQVVTLRHLAGLGMADVADRLGISLSTAESDWRLARAWLRQRLGPSVQ